MKLFTACENSSLNDPFFGSQSKSFRQNCTKMFL